MMNLLPKDYKEFVQPEYWDKFFKKRGSQAFEWYGEYPELCGILHKYIKPKDRLLVVGCGNSQLSADLYDVGYRQIVNIDISDVVIRQMTEKNRQQRPDMVFQKMDVFNLEFDAGEFSVVLDKGTLDALMVSETEEVVKNVDRMFGEIDRVLRVMGRYVCISLLQEHILKKVLTAFTSKGYAVRIHRIHTQTESREFQLPAFTLIFTKFKPTPGMPQILEVSTADDKVERFSCVDDVIGVVKEMQCYAMIRQRISEKKVDGDQISVCLYGDLVTSPRYTLTIIDSPSRLENKFAIFIVPQGRESEWMFSTEAGRRQLSASAGFERLIVVSLDRNHSYADMDMIKAELSTKVMELAPPGFKAGTQVPFLSLGADLGQRTILERGTSDLSGDYVVEDVTMDTGSKYRRLFFLSTPNIVQSEAKLITAKTQKRGKSRKPTGEVIDKSYLSCQHHVAMVAGIAMVLCDDFKALLATDLSVLLIGLGGGGLPSYIHHRFPAVTLDVVDIDPTMVSIATKWFRFQEDKKLRSHVADGLEFIKGEVKQGLKRHVVMLDVDSKDVTVGMSCPPLSFVEKEFLLEMKTLLHNKGVLVLNLVCRDDNLRSKVIEEIKTVFTHVYLQTIPEEVNKVLYAVKSDVKLSQAELSARLQENLRHLNSRSNTTRSQAASGTDGEEDFVEQFQSLTLV